MALLKLEKKQNFMFLSLLIVALFLTILFFSTLGIANISFSQTLQTISSRVFAMPSVLSETHEMIIMNIRLPRLLLAALIGGGMSIIGLVYQSIFNNPMADPFVIGTSSGAALGAAIAIIFFSHSYLFSVSIAAFIGAMVVTILTYFIATTGRKAPIFNLLLAGITINYLATALISILMVFYQNSIEKIIFWTLGSVSTASWQEVEVLTVVIVLLFLFLFCFSKSLNSLLLGEDVAQSIGVNVNRTKIVLLLVSSFAVALMVSISGIIGFVGLVIPHITKLLFGINHKVSMPLCFFVGAIFMVCADTVARTLFAPAEIPLGVITALLGAPYFLYLLYKHKKVSSS